MSEDDGAPSRASFDLPADPEMWTLARMGVSAIATRLDFGIDEIEDLRLAVSELCSTCAEGATAESRIVLECSWDRSGIEVRCEVSGIADSAEVEGDETELSRRILAALTDEHEIGKIANGVRGGSFRKGREPADR
jgi:serine/threonine-protein kinase RsbW